MAWVLRALPLRNACLTSTTRAPPTPHTHPRQALHLLFVALRIRPQDPLVLNELGVVYLRQDRSEVGACVCPAGPVCFVRWYVT